MRYRAYDDPKPARFVGARRSRSGSRRSPAPRASCSAWWSSSPWSCSSAVSRPRARARRVAIALGIAVAVIAPWTIRNAVQFHTFVPVSNNVAHARRRRELRRRRTAAPQIGLWRETFSRLAGNAADATLPQAQACFEGFDIADPHFDEAAAASTRHARRARLRPRPPRLAPEGRGRSAVLRTWGLYAPRQQVDFESLEGRPRAWQMRGTVMYWVLLPFAIVGAVVLRRRRRLLWPLARDGGDGDDRRGLDVRPAALPASRPSPRSWCWPRWRSTRCGRRLRHRAGELRFVTGHWVGSVRALVRAAGRRHAHEPGARRRRPARPSSRTSSTTLHSMPEHLRAGVAAESIVLGGRSWLEHRLGRLDEHSPDRRASTGGRRARSIPIRQYVRLLHSLVLFAENEFAKARAAA